MVVWLAGRKKTNGIPIPIRIIGTIRSRFNVVMMVQLTLSIWNEGAWPNRAKGMSFPEAPICPFTTEQIFTARLQSAALSAITQWGNKEVKVSLADENHFFNSTGTNPRGPARRETIR